MKPSTTQIRMPAAHRRPRPICGRRVRSPAGGSDLCPMSSISGTHSHAREGTTVSPPPHARTFSRSSTTSVGSVSSDEITRLGDEPRKKPTRCRSATVAPSVHDVPVSSVLHTLQALHVSMHVARYPTGTAPRSLRIAIHCRLQACSCRPRSWRSNHFPSISPPQGQGQGAVVRPSSKTHLRVLLYGPCSDWLPRECRQSRPLPTRRGRFQECPLPHSRCRSSEGRCNRRLQYVFNRDVILPRSAPSVNMNV